MKLDSVKFGYGVLAGGLEEQANRQGFTLGDDVERLEKIRDAVNMCAFHVATHSQVTAMLTKLQKKVITCLKKLDSDNEV